MFERFYILDMYLVSQFKPVPGEDPDKLKN